MYKKWWNLNEKVFSLVLEIFYYFFVFHVPGLSHNNFHHCHITTFCLFLLPSSPTNWKYKWAIIRLKYIYLELRYDVFKIIIWKLLNWLVKSLFVHSYNHITFPPLTQLCILQHLHLWIIRTSTEYNSLGIDWVIIQLNAFSRCWEMTYY